MYALDISKRMTLNQYIRELREKRHLDQGTFVRPLKITQAYLSRLERGLALPSEALIERLGKHYGADTEFMSKNLALLKARKSYERYSIDTPLLSDAEAALRILKAPPAVYALPSRKIPVINRAVCGRWKDSGDLGYPAGHADHYEPSDSKDPNAFFVIAEGDSMVGFKIEEGDLLLVETNRQPENGNIVLALHPDEGATVKKFFRVEGQIELRPGNENYPSIIIKKGDERFKVYRISEIKRKI